MTTTDLLRISVSFHDCVSKF